MERYSIKCNSRRIFNKFIKTIKKMQRLSKVLVKIEQTYGFSIARFASIKNSKGPAKTQRLPKINLDKIKQSLSQNEVKIENADIQQKKIKREESKPQKDQSQKPKEKSNEPLEETINESDITKEKTLSLKIIKCKSKDDIYRLYQKMSMRLKPIHYALFFSSLLKITKMQDNLNRIANSKHEQQLLWEDKQFIEIYQSLLTQIENMNADSLCHVMSALYIRKTFRPEFKQIYDRCVDWLIKEDNALLLDKVQILKVFVCYAKLSTKPFYANENNKTLYKLIMMKLKNNLFDQRTSNLLKVYRCMLRLKIADHKLFTNLNAQLKKRIHYIYPRELILSCAANQICNSKDRAHYIKMIINYFANKDLLKMCGIREKINLIVLLNYVLEWKEIDLIFKNECEMMMDKAINQVIDFHLKNLKDNKAKDAKSSATDTTPKLNTEIVTLKDIDKFCNTLIRAKKFSSKMVDLIDKVLRSQVNTKSHDYIYFLYYILEHQKAKNDDCFPVMRRLFDKCNQEFTKASGGSIEIYMQILDLTLGQLKTNPAQLESSKSAIIMIFRKMIHSFAFYSHMMNKSTLIRLGEMLRDNAEIQTSSNKTFNMLDFLLNSINKNLIIPLIVDNSTPDTAESQLKLNIGEKTRQNIINCFYMLTSLFSNQYPVIEDPAIFDNFSTIITKNFEPSEISTSNLDLLTEIMTLFENSVSPSMIRILLTNQKFKDTIEKRLLNIQENNLKRRENIRSALEMYIKDHIKSELNIEFNKVMIENFVADLSWNHENKKYVVIMFSGEEKFRSDKYYDLYANKLREKLLIYSGYKPLFLNIVKWINLSEIEKRNLVKEFFKM